MDPALISNFIRLPTAKMVWDSIATTYFDGTDTSKGYDLRRRVTRMRQAGGPIEKFYDDFQGLWREIDFRHPNPMECAVDIQKYNSIIQEDRVYTFLNGLDDRLDKVRSDVLQQKPFPTVEQAYAQIRCEDIRQAVMITGSGLEDTTGVVMASKGVKLGQQYSSSKLGSLSMSTGKLNTTPKAKKQQKIAASNGGLEKAALTTVEPRLSFTSEVESSSNSATLNDKVTMDKLYLILADSDCDWIIISGVTDHMTFDANDFSKVTQPRRTTIANPNGVTYPVTGAGTVALSSSLALSHTLLVPSLSNKLLSVSQVTA
ncbi:hypothetical protein GH714_004072 [Hevea brasiliensis]|uniref:Retrovirus-related Pol polyprotein from transposon TNT 1-94-like beta-barrel domain-containing protein n=1 Tax=Hevea brasiliensis TaxID=3981 RepID=A0A6A6NFJ8_HEVBR|nr:hypothetical protein GH714_004072 [Hevea brasiliensis]